MSQTRGVADGYHVSGEGYSGKRKHRIYGPFSHSDLESGEKGEKLTCKTCGAPAKRSVFDVTYKDGKRYRREVVFCLKKRSPCPFLVTVMEPYAAP